MTAATLLNVSTVPSASGELVESGLAGPDEESREWLRCLHAEGSVREDAIARLHALLVRAASFEVARRRPSLPHLRGNDLDDIANQAADDALVSVLRRLDDYRGDSRFTTWVYKFALLEKTVQLSGSSGTSRPCQDRVLSLTAASSSANL